MDLIATARPNPHTAELIREVLSCDLPDLIPEYAWLCNPHYEAVKRRTEMNMIRTGLIPPEQADLFIKADYLSFPALIYPYASEPQLQVVSEFTTWLWLMDDFIDAPDFPDAAGFFLQVTDIMAGHPCQSTHIWITWFYEVWQRLALSPGQQERIRTDLVHYYKGNLLPEDGKYTPALTIEDYMAMRQLESGIETMLVLAEYCLDIDLTGHITGNLRRLIDAFANHVALTNDIWSLKKEVVEGNRMNGVLAIMQQQQCNPREAIDRCYALCMKFKQQFEALYDDLYIGEPGVRKYLSALKPWLAGYFQWTIHTSRYDHEVYATPVR